MKGVAIGAGVAAAAVIIGIVVAMTAMDDAVPGDGAPTQTDLGQAPPADVQEVRVGILLPLTGELSSKGEENMVGTLLGIHDFNDHLAEAGHAWKLVSVSEDSQTNPAIALEKLMSLKAKDIDVVIGPETSSNIRNVKGYADANNMVLISCCSTAPGLAVADDSVFRLAPDDSKQGPAISALLRHQGIEAVVPIYRADAWGDGLHASSVEAFAADGGIVVEGVRYPTESHELSVSVSVLADKVEQMVEEHGADKVGVLLIGFAESLQIMQSASTYDVLDDVQWFGSDANTNEHKIVDDKIGLEFSTNVQFTTTQFAHAGSDLVDKVNHHIEAELSRTPGVYAHSSYDAAWVVGLAVLAAQEAEGTMEPSVEEIKRQIPIVAADYVGSIGSTELNEAGDLVDANYAIWGIRDGGWKMVGNYTPDTGKVSIEG